MANSSRVEDIIVERAIGDILMALFICGSSGFRVKQGSEIAPPRRGGRGENRIKIAS